MFYNEQHIVYKEIFQQKIKPNTKILLTSNNTKIIVENIDIINDLNLTIHFDEKNENEHFYDIIIFDNINSCTDEQFEILITKFKKMLKAKGVFMFIYYRFTLNEYLNYINITGINIDNMYSLEPSSFHEKFYNNNIKIIDNYRLDSSYNFIISTDTFLLTCAIN